MHGDISSITIPDQAHIRNWLQNKFNISEYLARSRGKDSIFKRPQVRKAPQKIQRNCRKIYKKKDLPQGFMNEFKSKVAKLEKFNDSLRTIDSGSTTFRYPEKVNGSPSIENPIIINFIDIKEAFDDATTVLTFTHDVIADYLNLKTQRAP
ncbi:hypothetical protein [Chromobacterium vaccinii]|uniref:hypothetical protein n=1 Tax=Chromobacterium vaccinii TaxID=1108595 RepID=UPI001E32B8E5|nr:hypothetical protein [Chromobacterium vaccinii]MCD4499382.1 hypothetical protein [Chromobacterium vaccinii]